MSNDSAGRNTLVLASVLFACIAAMIVVDLMIDFLEGGSFIHLLIELVILIVATGGVGLLWRKWQVASMDLSAVRVEAAAWRQESEALLRGLSEAIHKQFQRWELSPAESEVALMMLKGLSHQEIADARRTSERTIREQARAVYRKSGVSGRSSLSAFFLEDLLLPQQQQSDEATERVGATGQGRA